jgi:hypothetical protein
MMIGQASTGKTCAGLCPGLFLGADLSLRRLRPGAQGFDDWVAASRLLQAEHVLPGTIGQMRGHHGSLGPGKASRAADDGPFQR